MNVYELIEELKKVDGDLTVILAKDGEGNEFQELYEIETTLFDGESVHPRTEDVDSEAEPVVVLWP